MRILHLTPELPYWPGGSGGSTRQFHLLKRLVELGHEVTVVAPVAGHQRGALTAIEMAGIELRAVERPPSRLREALGAVLRHPTLAPRAARMPVLAWQVEVFWTALRPVAQLALRELRPDVVSVDHDNAAGWVGELEGPAPAVLTLHNVGWHYYANRAAAASGPRRAALRFEARRFRRHDLRQFGHYARLVAVSERDRDELSTASPGSMVDVVPNGVASDELTPTPEPEGPPVLLFTGTLNHPPNAEGIEWFADEAWPAIREQLPDATLLVVGREPPRSVTRLGSRPGIEVVGSVPDMREWYARATAVVVPLLSGGGSRLKILEALACGRAVASTSAGAEGLELEDARELLIANGGEAFAAATVRLLEERDLRRELAAAGRRAAEDRYDWRVLGGRLESVFTSAAS